MALDKFWKFVKDSLKVWTKYALLWMLLTLILRLGFFVAMFVAGLVKGASLLTILSGVYFDIALVLEVSAILLVPLLIINRLWPKMIKVSAVFFITFYAMAYGGLIGYYSNVNLPLDRVFFVYGIGEMYDIIVSSLNFSLWPLLAVAVVIALYCLLIRFWDRKIQISKGLSLAFLFVTMAFVIFFNFKSLITNDKHYKSYQDYCLASNQIVYTLNDFNEYRKEQAKAEDYVSYDEQVLKDARSIQRLFPDFQYDDIHYPFMREANDPDVLGPLMSPTNDGKAPDFVFIIVESLGQRLSSDNPKMSFTPFLDSLKRESLYWPNCLSLAERTFGAVPNIFSSAPYGTKGFARTWEPVPDHNSLLKEMSLNGYSLSFYYGGNASFDGQDEYMRSNGVGFIMKPEEADFDNEQKQQMKENNSWGMYDKDMFNAAIRHRDTTKINRPNTDIYITLSTHEPWCFKGNELYAKKVEEMVANAKSFGPDEKNTVLNNKKTYASYLYMDDCMKMLFDYYKSQPGFENTIFVIVGDHRVGRIYVNSSPLLKYNVPLIVYSPLLKAPKTFYAVVTHHDIAPTITAYLTKNYDYISADKCHWLGTSLDTASGFRSKQSVAFMRNSREEIEYLHDNYIIERDRIFKIYDSLRVEEIYDDAMRDTLLEYLRQYKNVDWFVTQNDYLWKKSADVVEVYLEKHDELITKNLGGREYFDIMEPYRFKQNYEKIYLDVEFDFKNKNNANLENVYSEFRIKGQSVDFFRSYRFIYQTIPNGDGTMRFKTKTTFFLAGHEIKNADFRINIFPEVRFDFEYENLKIRIVGLPLKK